MALNRERVLLAAIELADASGIESVSMRSLGSHLGVEAMSLYNHVANKQDVLSGMTDLVWSQVDLATSVKEWRTAIRTIALSVHEAFVRHPWSCRLHGAGVGPARLTYIDATLGHLGRGGFSAELAFHAHHTLDAHILGYSLQELDYGSSGGPDPATLELIADLSPTLPHFAEHLRQHGEGVPGVGFEIGLDLILDGLERSL